MFQRLFGLGCCLVALLSCGSGDGGGRGSMDYATRIGIDTQTNAAVSRLTIEIERYCRDSTAAMRQHLIDSLLVVRRAEMERTIHGVATDTTQ